MFNHILPQQFLAEQGQVISLAATTAGLPATPSCNRLDQPERLRTDRI